MEQSENAARIDGGKNYWCSWATQWAISKNKLEPEESKLGFFVGADARSELHEEMIFGPGGFAEQFPEVRGDLFLLLDDGWDVPFRVPAELGIAPFGSVIPNSERFPSFPGTPAQRLKGISDKLRAMGWRGLGLWISPTMTGEDFHRKYEDDPALHEQYWKERALWCKEAGVGYWKVDWGSFGHGDIVAYRRMISRVGKRYYPELIIEQTTCSAPYNGIPAEGKNRYTDFPFTTNMGKEVCQFCDVYRTYDVTDDMLSDTTTLDRLAYFLSFSPCVMNCEDALYIGAALGCALGVMRSHYGKRWLRMNRRLDEVTAAVKWQRYAPAFAGGKLKASEDLLVDRMFFGPLDTWNKEIRNRLVEQAAPAVMARNTELPAVTREEKMPFVIASMNPSGVYSLAAVKRREFLFDSVLPTVRCDVGTPERVGIFGEFRQVGLTFDRPPQKMYGQSLIRGEERVLDPGDYLTGTTVTLSRELLEGFNTSCDESENAVMFRFEF